MKPRDGYREPTMEEREQINAYGGCQVIRVGANGDRACPNRAEVDGFCAWHDLKFRKGRPDPEPVAELFEEPAKEGSDGA